MLSSLIERLSTLFIKLRHLINIRWVLLRQSLSCLTTHISKFWAPVQKYPLTPEQRDERRTSFITSINKGAVGVLASRYINQKECLVSDTIRHGSYNVCLFVAFPIDNTQWVVRIPVSPPVDDAWDKVQSEVATMRLKNEIVSTPSLAIFWDNYTNYNFPELGRFTQIPKTLGILDLCCL
ncbi:hypothetical protein HRG_014884 [Hirsutella rhossiliensis]